MLPAQGRIMTYWNVLTRAGCSTFVWTAAHASANFIGGT
jgi:hypothetical protein